MHALITVSLKPQPLSLDFSAAQQHTIIVSAIKKMFRKVNVMLEKTIFQIICYCYRKINLFLLNGHF